MAVKFLLDTNVVIYLLGGRLKQRMASSQRSRAVLRQLGLKQ
jgi:predicted nucleic acid-binding protein